MEEKTQETRIEVSSVTPRSKSFENVKPLDSSNEKAAPNPQPNPGFSNFIVSIFEGYTNADSLAGAQVWGFFGLWINDIKYNMCNWSRCCHAIDVSSVWKTCWRLDKLLYSLFNCDKRAIYAPD
jgi:hypothetical protein